MSKSSRTKTSCSSKVTTKTKQFTSKVNKRRAAANKAKVAQKPGATVKRGQVSEGSLYQYGDTTVRVIKAVTDKNNFVTVKNQMFGSCPTSKLKIANKGQVNKYLQKIK